MSPADAVFSHCRFVWLGQTNVPVVFLDPGINRTASLPNVNLTTLTRYAVDARSFQSQVILHWPKKFLSSESHFQLTSTFELRNKMAAAVLSAQVKRFWNSPHRGTGEL
jgi:hypothetical protein